MGAIRHVGVILLLAVVASSARRHRGTPDGETPAEETFCNQYSGFKGPLFGLCTSYCEAMDCDSPGTEVVERACNSVGMLLAKAAAATFNLDFIPDDPDEICRDTDEDGHPDFLDNCPLIANPTQANSDTDSHGDACDNCPLVANEDQADSNGNGVGDVCEVPECPCEDLYAEFVAKWETEFGIVTSDCGGTISPGTPDTVGATFDGSVPPDSYDMVLRTSEGAVPGGGSTFLCSASFNINGGTPPEFSDFIADLTAAQVEECNDLIFQAQNDLCIDTDNDEILDGADNCVNTPNADQANSDTDSHGDVCDNCPTVDNEDQADSAGNGVGDACDCLCHPTWGNGIGNDALDPNGVNQLVGYTCWVELQPNPPVFIFGERMRCVLNTNITTTYVGELADDEDGTCEDSKGGVHDFSGKIFSFNSEQAHACWNVALDQGATIDTDTDNDKIPDSLDNCPTVDNEDQADSNNNGVGDACETDCGNRITESPEECDDGNNDNGDGCSSTCETEASICPCAGVYAQAVDIWTNDLNLTIDTCAPINIGVNWVAHTELDSTAEVCDTNCGIRFSVLHPSPQGTDTCCVFVTSNFQISILEQCIPGLTQAEGDACIALMNVLCPL